MHFWTRFREFFLLLTVPYLLLATAILAQDRGGGELTFPELHGAYLGQPLPGKKPVLFAPGIISTDLHDDFGPAFTPDGNEVFFRCIGAGNMVILHMQLESGVWSKPEIAPFSGEYNDLGAFISDDGSRLFFSSDRPTGNQDIDGDLDIFAVDRLEDGWSDAYSLFPQMNKSVDWFACSVDAAGTLYFHARDSVGKGDYDLYQLSTGDSAVTKPCLLGPPVNTKYDETSPCIAHDGSFLVYCSGGEGAGTGKAGLYVTFLDSSGQWTEPLNLSKHLGLTLPGKYPVLSADGKYLFFVVPESKDANGRLGRFWRLDVFRDAEPRYGGGNIYWVDVQAIEAIRPENSD